VTQKGCAGGVAQKGCAEASAHRGGFENALRLLLQGSDGAVARDLGGVVELVDVGDAAGVEGVLEEANDVGLQFDDLVLELELGDCCVGLSLVSMLSHHPYLTRPPANRPTISLGESIPKPPIVPIVLRLNRQPIPRQGVPHILISNAWSSPVHGPLRPVTWLVPLPLDVLDLLLELLDLVILTFISSLLFPPFVHLLIQVHACGEGANDCGDEGCYDEPFLR